MGELFGCYEIKMRKKYDQKPLEKGHIFNPPYSRPLDHTVGTSLVATLHLSCSFSLTIFTYIHIDDDMSLSH